jgi:integrase
VRFLLLTACRRSEASSLRWSEIENGVWSLPAARNKTKEDLVRPLSAKALDIVNAQPRLGAFVFSFDGDHALTVGRAMYAFREKCGIAEHWTIHDIRRTARTLMSRANVPVDHAERALGHVVGGVRSVYDRHTYEREMAHAFEQLAAQIEHIVAPPEGNLLLFPQRQG